MSDSRTGEGPPPHEVYAALLGHEIRTPQAHELQEGLAQAEAQTLRAIRDLRVLREQARRAEQGQRLAESQQLRGAEEFRAMYRRSRALNEQLEAAYLETVTALARAVEARDGYTGGHVERVRELSLRTGQALDLPAEDLRVLEFGAVLHDIGKIGVPDAILRKSGSLDPDEWTLMRQPPEIGRALLEGVSFLEPCLGTVGHHHERWDGGGYPGSLAGEEIPLCARILAVADAYDAMTSDRPYRRRLPEQQARAEISRYRGSQFDPDIAEVFLTTLPQI